MKRRIKKKPIIILVIILVIPIIIYTGDKKWNAKKDFKDLRLTYSSFKNSRINLAYNIIDLKGYIEILSKN